MSTIGRTAASGKPLEQSQSIDAGLPERSAHPEQTGDKKSELDQIVAELQAAASDYYPQMEALFRVDRELGVIVVTIHDGQSHKVLRQIPAEEALRLSKLLRAGRQRLLDRLL